MLTLKFEMDILMNNISKLCSLPSSCIIGVTAAIGFVNYYLMFAVKVRIKLKYIII